MSAETVNPRRDSEDESASLPADVREARPFKIAFVGSHGVGKTTLCFGLAARLKARNVSLEVVHEVARRCPLPINEETSLEAQAWILHTQIAEELLAQSRYSTVICDRGVIDNYAYLKQAHGDVPVLSQLVDGWMPTYGAVVLVPTTEAPGADGIRAADPVFQAAIELRVLDELTGRGVVFHDLRPIPREGWLDRVEAIATDALRPPQLPLAL
ncbi:MAG: ATP-binding protein [Pseudomonadota bacterium]